MREDKIWRTIGCRYAAKPGLSGRLLAVIAERSGDIGEKTRPAVARAMAKIAITQALARVDFAAFVEN